MMTFIWFAQFVCLIVWLSWGARIFGPIFSKNIKIIELEKFRMEIKNLKEILSSGNVIESKNLESIDSIRVQSSTVFCVIVRSIQAQGGQLSPVFDRWEAMTKETISFLLKGHSQTRGALIQSACCLSLPILILTLFFYQFELTVDQKKQVLFAMIISEFLILISFVWVNKLAQLASRGGLSAKRANDPLMCLSFIEYLLNQIHCGSPSDLAWQNSIRIFKEKEIGVVNEWKKCLTNHSKSDFFQVEPKTLQAEIALFGAKIETIVFKAMLDGTAVREKLESIENYFLLRWNDHIEKKIQSLSHQALLPLYLLVFPAVFGFLFFSIWVIGVQTIDVI